MCCSCCKPWYVTLILRNIESIQRSCFESFAYPTPSRDLEIAQRWLELGGEALDFLSKTTLWNDSSSNGPRMELSIILMDLEMPIMDGLACTRRIRDLEREGKIMGRVPIIAVTANTRTEQIEQALEAGMVMTRDLIGVPPLIYVGWPCCEAFPDPRAHAKDGWTGRKTETSIRGCKDGGFGNWGFEKRNMILLHFVQYYYREQVILLLDC